MSAINANTAAKVTASSAAGHVEKNVDVLAASTTPLVGPATSPFIKAVGTSTASPIIQAIVDNAAAAAATSTTPLASPATSPFIKAVRPTTASPVIQAIVNDVAVESTTPLGSPVASPIASPFITDFGTPIASIIASPLRNTAVEPSTTPLSSPVISPLASPFIKAATDSTVDSAFVSASASLAASTRTDISTTPAGTPIASPFLKSTDISSTEQVTTITITLTTSPFAGPKAKISTTAIESPILNAVASPVIDTANIAIAEALAKAGITIITTPVVSPVASSVASPVIGPSTTPAGSPIASPFIKDIETTTPAPLENVSITPIGSPLLKPASAPPSPKGKSKVPPSGISKTVTKTPRRKLTIMRALNSRKAAKFIEENLAAASGEDTSEKVIYISTGAQTLPPLDGAAFRAIHGRAPNNTDTSKMGIAALGRLCSSNPHDLRYGRPFVAPSPASSAKHYADSSFQTQSAADRIKALTKAKAKAAFTAKRFGGVCEAAHTRIFAESRDERVVHSECVAASAAFDAAGMLVSGHAGRVPNVSWEEMEVVGAADGQETPGPEVPGAPKEPVTGASPAPEAAPAPTSTPCLPADASSSAIPPSPSATSSPKRKRPRREPAATQKQRRGEIKRYVPKARRNDGQA